MSVWPRIGRFDLDFAQPRARTPRLAWLLLAAGVTAATITAVEGERAAGLLSELDGEIARMDERLDAARRAARIAPRAASERAADAAVRADALRISRSLRQPWAQLLDALEADMTPQVKLVQIGFDAQFRRAQVQIEARSLNDVFHYTHQLASVPQVGAVTLVQHEWRDAPGARVVSARIAVDAAPAAPGARAPGAAIAAVDGDRR